MKPIYIFIASILIVSCTAKTEVKEHQFADPTMVNLSKSQLSMLEIELIEPEYKALDSYIYLSGKVKPLPNLHATVSANIEGKIGRVNVLDGQYVKKGQPLMSLSSMELVELQDLYMSAKSEKDFLYIEYKRQEELKLNKIGALAEFQTVESKYKAAISKEKSLAAKLEMLGIDVTGLKDPGSVQIQKEITITAPINGYVYQLPVSVGMLANRETILARIIDVKELYAEIHLYDKDLDLVKEGQVVELEFINQTIPTVEGVVYSIDRVMDEGTRSVSVHVKFKPPGNALVLPDMTVKAKILNRKNNDPAFIVPISALLEEEDHYHIFFSEERQDSGLIVLKKCKVDVGDKNDSKAEIVFPNPNPQKFYVASNNVMALESERKKRAIH